MKEEKLVKIVVRNIPAIRKKLALQPWRMRTFVDSCRGNAGQNERSYQYKTATIKLDHRQIRDEHEAVDVLRHEFLHCVLAPIDRIETVCKPLMTKKEFKMLEDVLMEVEHDVLHHLELILGEVKPAKHRKGGKKRKSGKTKKKKKGGKK